MIPALSGLDFANIEYKSPAKDSLAGLLFWLFRRVIKPLCQRLLEQCKWPE